VLGLLLCEAALCGNVCGPVGLLVLRAGRRRGGNLVALECLMEAVELRENQLAVAVVLGACALRLRVCACVGRSSAASGWWGRCRLIGAFVGCIAHVAKVVVAHKFMCEVGRRDVPLRAHVRHVARLRQILGERHVAQRAARQRPHHHVALHHACPACSRHGVCRQ